MVYSDVVIIGGGPAGLSFACSLADSGLGVTVIEKQDKKALKFPKFDGRDTAVSQKSKHILEAMGVWDCIPKDKIFLLKEAKVFSGSSAFALHMDAEEVGADTLGYIIPNYILKQVLYEKASQLKNVEIITGQTVQSVDTGVGAHAVIKYTENALMKAKLIVAADSRFSPLRRAQGICTEIQDLGEVMIVCEMTHEEPHHHIAYECFHYGRTLAVLPLSDRRSSVIVTAETPLADKFLSMSPEKFAEDIEKQFENRYGKMILDTERIPYPLVMTYANTFVKNRFALLGDAAVGMHPVTAHGFNLGLLGQRELASQIKYALSLGIDIGSKVVLDAYNNLHQKNCKPLFLATKAISNLYTNDGSGAKLLRKGLLQVADKVRPIKNRIIRKVTA